MGVLSQPPPPSRDDDPTPSLRRGGKYRGSGGRSQAPSTEEPMVPPWTPSFLSTSGGEARQERGLAEPAKSRATMARRRSGGTGRRAGLKIRWGLAPCGFDSHLRHRAANVEERAQVGPAPRVSVAGGEAPQAAQIT